jgi:hypothetical protein
LRARILPYKFLGDTIQSRTGADNGENLKKYDNENVEEREC